MHPQKETARRNIHAVKSVCYHLNVNFKVQEFKGMDREVEGGQGGGEQHDFYLLREKLQMLDLKNCVENLFKDRDRQKE